MNGRAMMRPGTRSPLHGCLIGLCVSIVAAVALFAGVRPAGAIDTIAREMILVDATTGTVLAEKNPDERMPPSSMSKLMTLYVVFELLRDGKLKMEDSFGVKIGRAHV